VNGATGGIGSAAVQFLKARGVVVTAVCDTPSVELVEGLGADRVIDRNTTDFTTDRERYDAVLDAVGKSSFFRCRPILEPHGRYLSSDLGPLSMNPFLALATKLWPGRHASMPLPGIRNQRVVLELRSMLEAGTFRPVIDRAYPLKEIAEAYRYVETGTKIGNVLISVTG